MDNLKTTISDFSQWLDVRSLVAMALLSYLILVRNLRYRRMKSIEALFTVDNRALSSMTVEEATKIINNLQRLEFPSAFAKARRMALLKVMRISLLPPPPTILLWFLMSICTSN